ncbi:MAG: electron transfer flavoprotein subunit beta/FixA family protein [Desulfomonilia bacterium]
MSINIIVCAKQVPDPEGPPASYEVDSSARKVNPIGIPPVINPFDQNALEAAIRIKEADGSKITLLSLGNNISRMVILKAVASGADEYLLVEGPELDPAYLDSQATAFLLAAAVRKIGKYGLILCGQQASDTNAGQVGLGLAQILGIPSISLARKVEVSDGRVIVERVLPDGYETMEAPLPALVTVSSSLGDLRYPNIQAIKTAKSIPHTVLSPADLDEDPGRLGLIETITLTVPSRKRRCIKFEAKIPEEAGHWLAEKLIEEKIL